MFPSLLTVISYSLRTLRFWDAETGKRHFDATASDIRWKTNTCTLGFNVSLRYNLLLLCVLLW